MIPSLSKQPGHWLRLPSSAAAKPPSCASTTSRGDCWRARSGPKSSPSSRRRSSKLNAYYQSNPDEAVRLISVGESKADPALAPATLAAWTMLANELMNLDEFLNK